MRVSHQPSRTRLLLTSLWFTALTVLAAASAHAGSGPAEESSAVGTDQLYRLDLLPRLRAGMKVASISSYDRTGGNDDGFSGKYSFIRKEGDGLVIADLKGPGVITRIWTPTPTDDRIEFFFDGEADPRLALPFRRLFTGEHAPFLTPVVGHGSGGFWSYLPLPYRVSCKVVIRAPKFQFYQINYATYPDEFPIASFDPKDKGAWRAAVDRIGALFDRAGSDVTRDGAPAGAELHTTQVSRSVAPGRTATLFEAHHGGRIIGLRLGPAGAFAGKARDLVLNMTWDGADSPAVRVPVADFFGYSWGEPAARSLLLGTDGDTCYCYLPMPFDRSARIELQSEAKSGRPVEVRAEVVTADTPRRDDEGRFYALWRRENPTTGGKPFTFIDTPGRGHLVGVTLQAQGAKPGETPFFEGDDQGTIDGELAIHGTGSEDFFNGGWYDLPSRWYSRRSYPLTGCLDYQKPMGRTGAYRLFLADAYVFSRHLRLTIEHGPEGNHVPADYVGVTYLYAAAPPAGAGALAPLEDRHVHDPARLIFTPGWNVPIYFFPLQKATLAKKNEKIDSREVRYLSIRAEGEDIFSPHTIAFHCGVPASGKYRISIVALTGPDQAQVELLSEEHPVAPAVDLYTAARRKSELLPMGTLTLNQGLNPVFFRLSGKNPKSTGLGLDLVEIHLEKQ